MRPNTKLIAALGLAALLSACKTPKDITYIQNLGAGDKIEVVEPRDITAQPGDRLSIVVHSKDPQLAEIFNLPIQARTMSSSSTGRRTVGGSSSNNVSSYVVDNEGNIQFPILGTLHIGGLTRAQIEKLVADRLIAAQLLKDPTVKVEFLDHAIIFLGEVGNPGRQIFDRDRINIIEAISLAGDLKNSGKRTNVKVIRMEDGEEHAYEVDLTDASSVYSSPVFYLQPNDVVYVEPNNVTKRNTTALGNSAFSPGFWISLASFAVSMVLLIRNWN